MQYETNKSSFLKSLVWFYFALFFTANSYSQSEFIRCDNEAYHQQLSIEYPQYLKSHDSLNVEISKLNHYDKNFDEITIPVVIHIVFKNQSENLPLTRILSQIDVLNEDFNQQNSNFENTPLEFQGLGGNAKIKFCLANIDPMGNFSTGITYTPTNKQEFSREADDIKFTSQGGRDAWDTRRYLNIWVGDIGSTTLGYAPLVGSLPPDRDGVVINFRAFGRFFSISNPFNQGRTCTHEVGHFFNLIHTWGNGGGCFNDDWVSDTPTQFTFYEGCPQNPQQSCGSNDMFMNFMDYPQDACLTLFSKGQVQRMRNTLLTARIQLWNWYDCTFVGIDEKTAYNFELFPNPATNNISIKLDYSDLKIVQIIDLSGRILMTQNINSNEDLIIIDIHSLVPGNYIIKLQGQNHTTSKMFIKANEQ